MKVPRGDAWRFIEIKCLFCKEKFRRRAKNQKLCSYKCRMERSLQLYKARWGT